MSKIKYVVIGGTSLLVVGAVITGGLLWHRHAQAKLSSGLLSDTTSSGANEFALQQNANDGAISLNPADRSQSSNSSDLSVGNASGSIGQLGGNGSDQGLTGSNSSSSSAKKQTNPFDPSTYAQYDKYINDNNAYFADAQVGTGDTLTTGKKAAVYYRGWLTNGKLFDESKPGSDGQLQAFVFQMGAHNVIPGWEQALDGMKVGGVRLIIVPPTAGYGAAGQPPSIPGNSVLIFQVQLGAVQ